MRRFPPQKRGIPYSIFLVFFALISAYTLSADTRYHRDLQPKSARFLASGGAASLQGGVQSFFHNPAAAAAEGSGWHILYGSAWGSSPISLLELIDDMQGVDEFLSSILLQVQSESKDNDSEKPRFSTGTALGFGRSGAGLNAGLFMQLAAESGDFTSTSPYLNSPGSLDAQISAHLGWVQEISFEHAMIAAGFQVRPMFRIHTPLQDEIPAGGIADLPSLSGSALSFDAGFYAAYHRLRAGIAIRNFIPAPLDYSVNRFSFVSEQLTQHFAVPSSSGISESNIPGFKDFSYSLPSELSIAAAYSFNAGVLPDFFRPAIEAEFRVPLFALSDDFFDNPFQYAHIGATANIFDILVISSGINQSYFSLGSSLRLWKFDLSLAARLPGTWDAPVERGPAIASFDFGLRL